MRIFGFRIFQNQPKETKPFAKSEHALTELPLELLLYILKQMPLKDALGVASCHSKFRAAVTLLKDDQIPISLRTQGLSILTQEKRLELFKHFMILTKSSDTHVNSNNVYERIKDNKEIWSALTPSNEIDKKLNYLLVEALINLPETRNEEYIVNLIRAGAEVETGSHVKLFENLADITPHFTLLVYHNLPKALEAYLKEYPHYLNANLYDGKPGTTLLYYAVQSRSIEVIRKLVELGADTNKLTPIGYLKKVTKKDDDDVYKALTYKPAKKKPPKHV